jgi:hypothetical protein
MKKATFLILSLVVLISFLSGCTDTSKEYTEGDSDLDSSDLENLCEVLNNIEIETAYGFKIKKETPYDTLNEFKGCVYVFDDPRYEVVELSITRNSLEMIKKYAPEEDYDGEYNKECTVNGDFCETITSLFGKNVKRAFVHEGDTGSTKVDVVIETSDYLYGFHSNIKEPTLDMAKLFMSRLD